MPGEAGGADELNAQPCALSSASLLTRGHLVLTRILRDEFLDEGEKCVADAADGTSFSEDPRRSSFDDSPTHPYPEIADENYHRENGGSKGAQQTRAHCEKAANSGINIVIIHNQ